MRKTTTAAVLALSLATGGAAGVTVFGPELAGAQSTTTTAPAQASPAPDRAGWVADTLKKLVDDKTITQAQADAVAKALADAKPPKGPKGPKHGRGHRKHVRASLDAAATALGMEEQALRDALRDGKSLAQIATERNVDKQKVIDALVNDLNTRLDEAVKAGRITQAQADEKKANARERITEMVEKPIPPKRGPRPAAPGATPQSLPTA